MKWTIELSEQALRDVDKLDPQARRRVDGFLYRRLAGSENPRTLGGALHGSQLGEYWKYRVGDYRLICKIEDNHLVVLVIRVGHRRNINR
ncbi:MAG TPA: type II toxin-antitoxin system RelE/ParE family toxin [Terriglobia bacterium]|nr:type II toxin-antitoxin system RelE/ParE family toxin [Terriglobia bacterium]